MKINYFKQKQFPWKNTIFIIGLPRSGKSTIYNILSSCNNTESLEEPFSILSIAQKLHFMKHLVKHILILWTYIYQTQWYFLMSCLWDEYIILEK